jgi:hypothetical protein
MQARRVAEHPRTVTTVRELAYPSPSRPVRRGIIAIIVAVTVAVVTATALLTRDGSASLSGARPDAVTAVLPDPGSISNVRLDQILGWVDGIVAGRILRTDLATRVWSAHPSDSIRVQEASTAILSLAPARQARAMSWLRGLADGPILWSDVTSRLIHQDQKLGKIVMQAWFVILGRQVPALRRGWAWHRFGLAEQQVHR